ncbi:trypsin-like peptidase domain-containing protein [Rathayibacter sp. YIM 133350]|uniref:S1C family serine protease n=1 Tax=Rathayibacter sp. YIM 133350 TaxID=3131992 RepID=UPI00307FB443
MTESTTPTPDGQEPAKPVTENETTAESKNAESNTASTTPVQPVAESATTDAAPAYSSTDAAPAATAAPTPAEAPSAAATQPTTPLPPQHTPAPGQQTGAFGQPATPNATVYAPDSAPHPYAQQAQYGQPQYGQPQYGQQPHHTQPTQPYGAQPYATTGTATDEKKSGARRATLPIVAALIAGALIGGVSGAGVTALVDNQNDSTSTASSTTPQNVVVNNSDSVNEITAVAAKASPSVVTISVTSDSGSGTGSGVILSKDGYVLTNTHVVTLDGNASQTTMQVQTSDGKLYAAKVVGTDPVADLAVIKLTDASDLTPLDFADSSKLNVGDSAIAIGAPLGLAGTVTNGIVSALNRSIQVASSAAPDNGQDQQQAPDDQGDGSPFDFWNFDLPGQTPTQTSSSISLPVIQTDAAINPGNSGGALLNSKGQLIGINVAIASASDAASSGGQSGSIGVGFAIPANLAKRVADEIIESGKASHGLLGASVQPADSTKDGIVGAQIKDVTSGGAADKGGLKAGDIITEFNGVPISDANDLTAQVRYLPAGAKADVTYTRDGKSATTTVTLGELTS